jgi:hypothetical protein
MSHESAHLAQTLCSTSAQTWGYEAWTTKTGLQEHSIKTMHCIFVLFGMVVNVTFFCGPVHDDVTSNTLMPRKGSDSLGLLQTILTAFEAYSSNPLHSGFPSAYSMFALRQHLINGCMPGWI